MQQLSVLDNMFLQADSSRTPMHITPVLLYDPTTARHGVPGFDDILEHFRSNLNKSPIFRRKLLRTPFDFDPPYWIEDEDFELEYHVRHNALPKPGDWRQLCVLISRLHSQRLNLNRPLWEAYVIDGLDTIEGLSNGSFAIVLKIHHAAIDGVSGTQIINALHSLKVDDDSQPSADDWQPESPPGAAQLMWRSYKNSFQRPTAFLSSLGKVIPAISNANKQTTEKTEFGQKFETRFNKRVSGHRVSDALRIDFEHVRQIKNNAPGVTVNDVVISIVGGGLRRYLSEKDELPEQSLLAGAPINTRDKDKPGATGNSISMMRIPLRTDIADPLRRLHEVNAGAVASKAYAKAIGVRTMTDILQSLSPQLLSIGIRAATAEMLTERLPTPLHTMVSNVPGPPVDLYMCGARLHDILALGPLVDKAGLFHGVTSIGGSMAITVACCHDMLPDPEFYVQCLKDSFEELCDASKVARV
jgi:WS/DGAT/MGAT family acyltransferase